MTLDAIDDSATLGTRNFVSVGRQIGLSSRRNSEGESKDAQSKAECKDDDPVVEKTRELSKKLPDHVIQNPLVFDNGSHVIDDGAKNIWR
jgi:hypothetical protein